MFKYLQPTTLQDALELLDTKKARILAGGTDLLIGLHNNSMECDSLLDCKKIPELLVLEEGSEGLIVGAAVSLSTLMKSGLLHGEYDVLGSAASVLANSMLRNRATIVGNLCNASPGADMAPACLVLGAVLVTASPDGGRTIPLEQFFTGVKRHVLAPNEIVVKIIFPRISGKGAFRKKQRIRGHDLAQVSVAGFLHEDGKLSLSFGAVATTPILLKNLGPYTKDELLQHKEELIDRSAAAVSPIDDVRSSKEYRIDMLKYFTGLIIDELAN